ncbi:MAG: glycosyltransferase [Candidatus Competibacteraceae bacterium]|nr:glycosyltransferase [Candidatus Competibacteraceae bacterium]MBK8895947.1 glycosyltransferase [Candidatus Competibacteraceae bacterium]
MRAIYLFQDEYPWDIRVEKIVSSMINAGILTTIVSRNRRGLPREERTDSGIAIRRLPKGLTSIDRNLLNFPAFFSPIWIRELEKAVIKDSADILIVRDLPLSPMAYYVGNKYKIPVIIDMAENYPAMIQDTWQFQGPNPFDYLIRNPILLRKLERWIIPKLNGIWVVSEASRRRVEGITGCRNLMWVVGNTPRIQESQASKPHPFADMLKTKNALRLLYVGGLEKTRGLQTVLLSLPIAIKKLGKNIHLLIVGHGQAINDLKNLVSNLQLDEHVSFAGWVDQQYVPGIISASDICLVPHYVTEHTNTTIPNKIYDYLAQGKPVIVSHAQALRDIVEELGCGRFYHDHDFEKLADILVELSNENLRKTLGNAGRAMVLEKYNWQADEKILLKSLEQMIESYSKNRKTFA